MKREREREEIKGRRRGRQGERKKDLMYSPLNGLVDEKTGSLIERLM